jgi:hypothetical protein
VAGIRVHEFGGIVRPVSKATVGESVARAKQGIIPLQPALLYLTGLLLYHLVDPLQEKQVIQELHLSLILSSYAFSQGQAHRLELEYNGYVHA